MFMSAFRWSAIVIAIAASAAVTDLSARAADSCAGSSSSNPFDDAVGFAAPRVSLRWGCQNCDSARN